MNLPERIKAWWRGTEKPPQLRHGELGERVAKKHLKRQGLKFLVANFRSARGEIDLIFRDGDCPQCVSFDMNIIARCFLARPVAKITDQLGLAEVRPHLRTPPAQLSKC
jgi:hypothetical protein